MPTPILEKEALHPAAGAILNVAGAPVIDGLVFRRFRGPSDYAPMAAVITASAAADDHERAVTAEDIALSYGHLTHSDPYQDMIFVEIDGRLVGYGRGEWQEELEGPHVFNLVGYLVPEWRRRGIGAAMLRWLEDRLRDVAATLPPGRERYFQTGAPLSAVGLVALLERAGYAPVRYAHDMVRPSLDDIPDFPLPEGLEVRPALPEHYRAIWDADDEAFRDHWGYIPHTEEDYLGWMESKRFFQPHLWQIAWDTATNEVAGQVKTYIDEPENEKFNRRRGYTEGISVRRPYRRRGLARALIARSLRLQREMGMTESALGVDSENLSGATRVYEDCGFRTVKRYAVYRKPL